MADSDWEQVNIRLQPKRKKRWTSTVSESPTYENLTHLIRLSVEKELNDEHDTTTQSSRSEDDSEVSGEILTTLNRIERSVDNMDDRLSAIEQESEAESDKLLRNAMFEILPPESELDTKEDGMTIGDISKKLGVSREKVNETIEGLQTSQIQSKQLPSHFGPDDVEHPVVYYRRG